ncbi:hypothetical protein [Sphaerisporangium sp. NPDC051011]|uniref:hypothetical protein n=1 Tax=Sphaerisporangium sp. NPDC051011 TaxID=3155792 RepID=UPI0033FCF9D6
MTPASREDFARRFPLVPRGRPACHRLDVRVRQVADLADAAPHDPAEAARIAAEAHNLGALIASDCGLPSLARDLCWRQFHVFRDAQPFDATTAKLALQPLVNLGRLLARDGNGTAAHRLIETLFTAVCHQSTVTLDDTIADLGNLTRTPDDHREIVQWLWTVLLADGTRALTQAGNWSQALQHVQDHHGIGQSLLDGRQIAIIAHHAAGDHRTSARLLTETITPTPWEQTVAACLAALTGNDNGNTARMVDNYLAIGGPPAQVVFRTRLGLAVLDLTDDRFAPLLAHTIETDVRQSRDAYAAREILAHTGCASFIPASTSRALTRLVDSSGLGAGTIPSEILDQFTLAMTTAEASLSEALSVTT